MAGLLQKPATLFAFRNRVSLAMTKDEDSGTTDGGYSTPDIAVQEKQDEPTAPEPEYATGFRLAAIMGTIFLSTLLAALDIVSPLFPNFEMAAE